ncbi:MAG: NAD-dependent epimerase/dehydratase family protein [Candidatus Bathyarchaeia archaeon]
MGKLLTYRTILVTGGAGFMGSHLVDKLIKNEKEVCVFDNLSSGSLENIKQWLGRPCFRFVRGDLLNQADIVKAVEDCDIIFHLAANPEVRVGSVSPSIHFEQNVVTTHNLLEAIRKSANIKVLVFTSSSTVYGDAEKIPTPEDYAPMKPISVYGASKLASEALICAYAHTYGFRTVIFRLANIVGSRSKHGVVYDFIKKLKENPRELEILGDGTQTKSYLHIDDCIEAMLLCVEKSSTQFEVFNLGSEDWIDVKAIAKIVIEEMGLQDVTLRLTGGVDGGRGWKGDVKYMLLDCGKLKALGWEPKLNSAQAVKSTAQNILRELDQKT